MKVGNLLRLHCVIVGTLHIVYTCLTWDVEGDTLVLTCRPSNQVQQLSFIDTSGVQQATCTFFEDTPTCVSYHNDGTISTNTEQMTISFTLNATENNFNGKWTCVQGFSEYSTTVSLVKGIIAATEVHLVGQVIGKNKIRLSCYSCRKPHGNYVEFFINGVSVDGLSYNHVSKKCLQRYGECISDKCSCSVAGNEFSRTFNIDDTTKKQNVSCEMRFMDPIQRYRFLQLATLYFKGKYLINGGLRTIVTKPAEKTYSRIYYGIRTKTVTQNAYTSKAESKTVYDRASLIKEVSPEMIANTSAIDINSQEHKTQERRTITIYENDSTTQSMKIQRTSHLPVEIKNYNKEKESTVDRTSITTITIFREILINKFNGTDLNKTENIYYGLLGAGIVLFLVFFVSLNAWVSRKCRQSELLIPIQEHQHVQQLSLVINNETSHDDAECNYCHYETIEENEMMEFPPVNGLNVINTKAEEDNSSYSEKDIDPQDSDTNSKVSSSSSDRSYLDVIGDYYTQYATVIRDSDPDDIHDYSVPIALNVSLGENNESKKICGEVHSRSQSI